MQHVLYSRHVLYSSLYANDHRYHRFQAYYLKSLFIYLRLYKITYHELFPNRLSSSELRKQEMFFIILCLGLGFFKEFFVG